MVDIAVSHGLPPWKFPSHLIGHHALAAARMEALWILVSSCQRICYHFFMIALVLDTNIVVSACMTEDSVARAVVRRCLAGQYRPLIGAALFMEYEDVMSREPLFERSTLSAAERSEVFRGFLAVCRWTEVFYAWRPNLPDEADNHLIELAVAGGAAAIVTRNLRDLSRGELRFPAIRILAPSQCLEVFA